MEKLLQRLAQLEAVNAIRNVLNRYMEICDSLNAQSNLNQLMALFDADALWEGVGERYAQTLGRHQGKAQIAAMFSRYMQGDAHFVLNAHFVNSEQIYVRHNTATGHWMMLQSSTFNTGASHLNAAKLTLQFKQHSDGSWLISHFQTENLFSRPIPYWEHPAALPVPSQNIIKPTATE